MIVFEREAIQCTATNMQNEAPRVPYVYFEVLLEELVDLEYESQEKLDEILGNMVAQARADYMLIDSMTSGELELLVDEEGEFAFITSERYERMQILEEYRCEDHPRYTGQRLTERAKTCTTCVQLWGVVRAHRES